MLESIKQYAEALTGLTEVPRARARRIAESLSKQGVIPTGQIRSVATGIVRRSRDNRHRIAELVSTQVRKQAGALGLATAEEIERLRRRVVALEGGGSTAAPARRGATRKPARPRQASAKAAPSAKRAAAARPTRTAAAARTRAAKPAAKRRTTAARRSGRGSTTHRR